MTRGFMNSFFPRYRLVADNIHIGRSEYDIVGIRKSGFVDEIEIKVSRADFRADFKKMVQVKNPEWDDLLPYFENRQRGDKWKWMSKHLALANGLLTPNYFAFLLPPALVDQCEPDIPEHAGLYEYAPELLWSKLRTVIKPKRLHSRKIAHESEMRILRKLSWRYINLISDVENDE